MPVSRGCIAGYADLSPRCALDSVLVRRFRREARLGLHFRHQNVIKIYDYDVGPRGQPMIVMEYVDGLSLADIRLWGELPFPQLRQILMQVLAGLDYIHQWGILHRDISPSNILLSRAGDVILADFGLMKLPEGEPSETHFQGTAPYASPEAVRVEPLDESSDLYSVGAVFYELIMGHPPHGIGRHPQIEKNQRAHEIPLLPESVPEDLRTLIHSFLLPREQRQFKNTDQVLVWWQGFDEDMVSRAGTGEMVRDAVKRRAAHYGLSVDSNADPAEPARQASSSAQASAPRMEPRQIGADLPETARIIESTDTTQRPTPQPPAPQPPAPQPPAPQPPTPQTAPRMFAAFALAALLALGIVHIIRPTSSTTTTTTMNNIYTSKVTPTHQYGKPTGPGKRLVTTSPEQITPPKQSPPRTEPPKRPTPPSARRKSAPAPRSRLVRARATPAVIQDGAQQPRAPHPSNVDAAGLTWPKEFVGEP